MILILALVLFLVIATLYGAVRGFDRMTIRMSAVFVVFYVLAFLPFALGMLLHSQDYYQAIDIVDEHYAPLAGKHLPTLLFYFVVYHFAAGELWKYKDRLPPLKRVLWLVFILIGLGINVAILLQVTGSQTPKSPLNDDPANVGFLFVPFLIMSLGLGFSLLFQNISLETKVALGRTYKNGFLRRINTLLLCRLNAPVWALVFLLPVLLFCTLLLIMLGQDTNSLTRVFTDTTTWAFSQKAHPPALNHTGHYLCTVAARGHPKIVKPILLGRRGGEAIIVNRQLQIANAFEELVGDISPRGHRIIRTTYDRWGYNLSRKINTEQRSSVTYILMKPLEWMFLLCLYAGCTKPEEKIRRQYQLP